MKYSIISICVFFTMIFFSNSAIAMGYYSGNDIVKLAEEWDKAMNGDQADYMEVGIYLGYVKGVIEKIAVENVGKSIIPDGVTFEQVLKVVYSYLDNNPDLLHYPAVVLVEGSIFQAFPKKD